MSTTSNNNNNKRTRVTLDKFMNVDFIEDMIEKVDAYRKSVSKFAHYIECDFGDTTARRLWPEMCKDYHSNDTLFYGIDDHKLLKTVKKLHPVFGLFIACGRNGIAFLARLRDMNNSKKLYEDLYNWWIKTDSAAYDDEDDEEENDEEDDEEENDEGGMGNEGVPQTVY